MTRSTGGGRTWWAWVVLGALVAGDAGALSGQGGPPAAPSRLLRLARTVVDRAEGVDDVWPGFWPRSKGFALADPGVGVLLHASTPPPMESGYSGPVEGGAPSTDFYYRAGEAPELGLERFPYLLEHVVGADTVTVVALKPDDAETLRLLYHEDFHAFQRGRFTFSVTSEMDAPWEGIANQRFRDSARAERTLLAEALLLADMAVLRSHLADYLAVRRQRYALMPSEIVAIERMLEVKEGTAELVGWMATRVALSQEWSGVVSGVCELLTTELPVSVIGPAEYWETRFRVYGTGAALGLLLDRLGVTWASQVTAGTPLDQILDDALGKPTGQRAVADVGDVLRRVEPARPCGMTPGPARDSQ